MDAIAIASCLSLTCFQKPLTVSASRERFCCGGNVFHCRIQRFKSLSFSTSLSSVALLTGEAPFGALQKPKITRRSVVCEAVPKKADSAAKRARQNEKRRIYHKAKKSEFRTRMKKVFEELNVLKKKTDAKEEEILRIEKLIAEAYSAIDKAVKSGTLHKNTGAHRKSRLARRKKAIEIHHGWYVPATAA